MTSTSLEVCSTVSSLISSASALKHLEGAKSATQDWSGMSFYFCDSSEKPRSQQVSTDQCISGDPPITFHNERIRNHSVCCNGVIINILTNAHYWVYCVIYLIRQMHPEHSSYPEFIWISHNHFIVAMSTYTSLENKYFTICIVYMYNFLRLCRMRFLVLHLVWWEQHACNWSAVGNSGCLISWLFLKCISTEPHKLGDWFFTVWKVGKNTVLSKNLVSCRHRRWLGRIRQHRC